MSKNTPAIKSVKARAVVTPMARPLRNAFGVIDVAPLLLIDVATDQGITGRSYLFAYSKVTLKPFVHLVEEIGLDLIGKPVAPCDLMTAMDAKFRLLGTQGLVGMAISGLDMAFWDILGQAADKPVVELLGGSPKPIKAYDSYGAVEADADEKALRRSLEQGFRGIKIKGGDGDAANDERRVKGLRKLLGPDISLMLDFNQSLDPAEAKRRIDRLAPYDLTWIEEPVPQENLIGACRGARDLADPDPVRRELVVSARLCRGDRGGRQRFHHARPDEGRRHYRMARCRRASGCSVDPDVEPYPARGQCACAGGDPDRALARNAGFRRHRPHRSHQDRERYGDRARAGSRARMERGGDFEISDLRRPGVQ